MVDYTKYGSVMEVTGSNADEYIELGWDLLFVGQHQHGDFAEIGYSLGWPKDKGERKLPKPRFKNLG